jgi:hypothetical protein
VGSSVYAIVASVDDDGVQIIDVSDPSSPLAAGSATDGVGGFDRLLGAYVVSTWSVGSSVYAIVAALSDDGVQIIDVSDPSSPVAVGSATDGAGGFEGLDGAVGVSTWSVGSSVYAIVASAIDDGVQIIDVSDPSSPVAAGSATDGVGGFEGLDGARGVSTWSVGGSVYAIVPSTSDDGVQIIDVAEASDCDVCPGPSICEPIRCSGNSDASNDFDCSAAGGTPIAAAATTLGTSAAVCCHAIVGVASVPLASQPQSVEIFTVGSASYALVTFAHGVEIIDVTDPSSPAPVGTAFSCVESQIASCSASSEYGGGAGEYRCENVYDGITSARGTGNDEGTTWATQSEGVGSWILLVFATPQNIDAMKYANRDAYGDGGQEANHQVRLDFSDGTSVTVDLLPVENEDFDHYYSFPPVTTSNVRITVLSTCEQPATTRSSSNPFLPF